MRREAPEKAWSFSCWATKFESRQAWCVFRRSRMGNVEPIKFHRGLVAMHGTRQLLRYHVLHLAIVWKNNFEVIDERCSRWSFVMILTKAARLLST